MDSSERGYNLRSYLLAIGGSALALGALCAGATLFLFVLVDPAAFTDGSDLATPLQVNLLASSLVVMGGLLVPAAVFSVRNILGKPQSSLTLRGLRWWEWVLLPLAWIGVLILATALFNSQMADWAIPALQALGVVLPIYILVRVAAAGIELGSPQHAWGAFASGMALSPILSAIVEITIIAALVAGLGIYLALQPESADAFESLVQRIERASGMEQMLILLGPLLRQPLTLFSALFYFSFLTPLIEEPIKSIGVWLGADRLRTPAQGFALGALCGAGFALVESMFATFSPDNSWGVTFLTRSASGLMHIAASGLIGWGIARMRLSRRYLPLIGMYVLGIAIHGVWNGAAISIVAGGLSIALDAVSNEINFLGIFMTLGGVGILFVMIIAIITFLPVFNHKLRREDPPQPPNEAVPAYSGEAM